MEKKATIVNLVNEYDGCIPFDEKEITTIADYILTRELEDGHYSLSVINCSDERIRELNLDYRGVDEPTDVLTFALSDDQLDDNILELGDIFLSIDTINQQASNWQNTPKEEYLFMLIHGLLHICGYDHKGPYQYEKEGEAIEEEMFRRQRSYFEALKGGFKRSESVGNPFA